MDKMHSEFRSEWRELNLKFKETLDQLFFTVLSRSLFNSAYRDYYLPHPQKLLDFLKYNSYNEAVNKYLKFFKKNHK
jgi:hypothetical protein